MSSAHGSMMQFTARLSWCVRRALRSWALNRSQRTLCSDTKPATGSSDPEEETQRKAQEFLDGVTGEMKKKLDLIEMEYSIRRANNEPVPTHFTSKHKRNMLLNIDTIDECLEYLYMLKNTETCYEKKKAYKKVISDEMQYDLHVREGSFICADDASYDRQFYKSRMAQTFTTGMPIVFDVGYRMNQESNYKLIKLLTKIYKLAKMHKQPAHFIVAGLDRNPILKETLENRWEIRRMMIDFRNESYWDIYPETEMVYLCDEGPELSSVDGNKTHVIFCGQRQPLVRGNVQRRRFPFYNSLYAGSKSLMLDFKAKVLMDMSLEKRGIVQTHLDNMRDPAFRKYMSQKKHYKFMDTLTNRGLHIF